jgi:hypothetical protein
LLQAKLKLSLLTSKPVPRLETRLRRLLLIKLKLALTVRQDSLRWEAI